MFAVACNIKENIKQNIQAIHPYDPIEQTHQSNTLAWIDSGLEIFRIKKPATPLKHLCCYMVLYDHRAKKILLLQHRKSGLLLPSGGHPEKNELLYECATRELTEELGIERESINPISIDPFFISISYTVGQTAGHIDVNCWFLFNANSQHHPNTNAKDFKVEFSDYKWYTIPEILALPLQATDKNMHRFIRKLELAMSI